MFLILDNILIIILLVSINGAIIYRLYSLNWLGIILSLILTAIFFFIIILYFYKKSKQKIILIKPIAIEKKTKSYLIWNKIFIFAYLLLIAINLYVAIINRTDSAIISPWQIIPPVFFIFYFLATVILILLIWRKTLNIWILTIIHYLFSFSLAIIIYKLGYGFDSFIHQATIKLINSQGVVNPKPFYYLGQYALELIIHKISFLPLIQIDKFLVPMLAGLFLPLSAWRAIKKLGISDNTSILSTFIFLIFPFSIFIVTTPQNLAYLFLILAILRGLSCTNFYDLLTIYLLATAAVLTQAIAGIPALLLALSLTIYHSDITKKRIKIYLYFLIFIFSALALPVSFYILGKLSPLKSMPAKINLTSTSLFSNFNFILPNQENFILNFLYLYIFNLKTFFILLFLGGLIIFYRQRKKFRQIFIYLFIALGLLISYFLTIHLSFSYLINYERANFSNRILFSATLFLLPLIIFVFSVFIKNLEKQNLWIKISFGIFVASLITASLYASYPRFDNYFNSHSYAVSQNDIVATHWIQKNASSSNYIVLANQQTSVAALSQFGFKKYYKNNIFYYPIPTSQPLYKYYLDMVYKKPSRKTMFAAMDLTGVNIGYFVLNKYWWAFPKILSEAKLSADSWKIFGQGDVYVFKYKK